MRVFSPVYPGQNVGRQGADIHAGQAVLGAGDVLTPSRVGALAALGIDRVEVFARPRVAILSTGNEIVEPGQPLAPGQIYDINRFTLGAIVAEHGGVPVPCPTAADTLDDLDRALDAGARRRPRDLLGRQLGRRARPDPRRHRRARARSSSTASP